MLFFSCHSVCKKDVNPTENLKLIFILEVLTLCKGSVSRKTIKYRIILVLFIVPQSMKQIKWGKLECLSVDTIINRITCRYDKRN